MQVSSATLESWLSNLEEKQGIKDTSTARSQPEFPTLRD